MKKQPFLIGLTGSIGMGKSTTATMFANLDVPVWDADRAVHRLYDVGGAAVNPMGSMYPDAVHEGAVDRDVLKKWIADDPRALSQIEEVVHPLVAVDRAEFIREATAKIILLDIPLLFETGADADMDTVVVVSAPLEVQRERVLKRTGMTAKQFEVILAKQIPDDEKRRRADYVIETTSLEQAKIQVQIVLDKIKEQINA